MADPGDTVQILNALGGLKTVVALTALGCTTSVAIVFLVVRFFERRAEAKKLTAEARERAAEVKRAEIGKSERATAMRRTWDALTRELSGLREDAQLAHRDMAQMMEILRAKLHSDDVSIAANAKAVEDLSGSISDLHRIINDVAARSHGIITRSASVRLIEDCIHGVLQRDLIDLFSTSLRKNDYANRAEFIKQRMRTLTGEAIGRVADNLRGYSLGVSPGCYFRYYNDEATKGVRFTLVDLLWERIRPLYETGGHGGIEQRLEELQITIKNVIDDTINSGRESVENIYDNHASDVIDPLSLFRASALETDPLMLRRHAG